MLRTIALVLSISIFNLMQTPATAQNIGSIIGGLPIDKLTEQLGFAVSWIVGQIKENKQQSREDSIGVLVSALSELSGLESNLADILENGSWHQYRGPIDRGRVTSTLNFKLNEIKTKFNDVILLVSSLNPTFVAMNGPISVDIGVFAHDGIVYYCSPSCTPGSPRIELLNDRQVSLFAQALRRDVIRIRELSAQLSAAYRESVANQKGPRP